MSHCRKSLHLLTALSLSLFFSLSRHKYISIPQSKQARKTAPFAARTALARDARERESFQNNDAKRTPTSSDYVRLAHPCGETQQRAAGQLQHHRVDVKTPLPLFPAPAYIYVYMHTQMCSTYTTRKERCMTVSRI